MLIVNLRESCYDCPHIDLDVNEVNLYHADSIYFKDTKVTCVKSDVCYRFKESERPKMIFKSKEINNKKQMRVKCDPDFRPEYFNEYAAGLDIKSTIDVTLHPGRTTSIPTKLSVELPEGRVGFLVARSGLSLKHGVKLANDIGTIDEDYRGEVKVKLINMSGTPYVVQAGDKIAQLVITNYEQPELIFTDTLSTTERGSGGLGHSGR